MASNRSLQHLYLPFGGATLVDRLHEREIKPPMFTELNNFIPAKSDNSPTLRPDIAYSSDRVESMIPRLTLGEDDRFVDGIAGATGIYGGDQLIYFTPFVPYGYNDGSYDILCDTHSEGPVTGEVGQSRIYGSGTTFDETSWRGAIVKVEADNNTYGSIYTGGFAKWVASPATSGEWYLTNTAGTTLPFPGEEIKQFDFYGTGDVAFTPGVIGSLGDSEANIGDNDTLGFTTLYIQSSTDPNERSAENSRWGLWYSSTGISGSAYLWTSSGAGTNEYYLSTLVGGDPLISGTTVTGVQYYSRAFDAVGSSFNGYAVGGNVLTAGTAGSLADLEYAFDADPGATYNTIHIRDDSGSPAENKSAFINYPIIVTSTTDATVGGTYKWTPSPAKANEYFLELIGGGDPGFTDFTDSTYDGKVITCSMRATFDNGNGSSIYNTQGGTPGLLTNNAVGFGDSDTHGWKTFYIRRDDGNPDVIFDSVTLTWTDSFNSNKYIWTESATVSNEYFLELVGGGDPSFNKPYAVHTESYAVSSGVPGSLNYGQWGWGDSGSELGYNTVYYRSFGDADPNLLNYNLVANYFMEAYCSKYTWTESGSGTDEYYCELTTGGGDPSITEPAVLLVNGTELVEGTAGSLALGEWDYAVDDPGGAYNTIHVRMPSGSTADPDGTPGSSYNNDNVVPATVGDLLSYGSGYDYYIVEHIVDDEEMIVSASIEHPISGTAEFYDSHNVFMADNALNIQSYTSGIVYGTTSIEESILEEDISGPFYLGLTSSGLGETTTTINSKWEYFVDYATAEEENIIRNGADLQYNDSLAWGNGVWIQCYSTTNTGVETDVNADTPGRIAYSRGIADGKWLEYYTNLRGSLDYWKLLTINGNDGSWFSLNSVQYNGGMFVGGCQYSSNDPGNEYTIPGVAYSSNGLSWTVLPDNATGYEWADETGAQKALSEYQAISAATDGTTIVVLYYRQSDNNIHVRLMNIQAGAFYDADLNGAGLTEFTGNVYSKVKYKNGKFFILGPSKYYSATADISPTWSSGNTVSTAADVDYGAGMWLIITTDSKVYQISSLGSNASLISDIRTESDLIPTGSLTCHIHYDVGGERWLVNGLFALCWSDDGIEWKSRIIDMPGEQPYSKNPSNIAETPWVLAYNGHENPTTALLTRFDLSLWLVTDTVVLSDVYRASSFSVIEGYVVLFGTREWEEILDDDGNGTGEYEWVYYPRRARWTAPSTYNDFESTGTGLADAPGDGRFVDSRPVNGRVVIFETNRVSAMIPRGDVDDPFDYEVIEQDFRIMSNPVVVNDKVYVVADDGLFYFTDGINVVEGKIPYDATKFDDYEYKSPINLSYCAGTNTLVASYYSQGSTTRTCYHISISDGTVTKNTLPNADDQAVVSRFITPVINSSDKRILLSYPSDDSYAISGDVLRVASYGFGNEITGLDQPVFGEDAVPWAATIETGELFVQPEGDKSSLRHLIFKTYCKTEDENRAPVYPQMYVEINPTGSDEWYSRGQITLSSAINVTANIFPSDVYSYLVFTGYPPSNLVLAGDGVTSATEGLPTVIPGRNNYYLYDGSSYSKLSETDYTDYGTVISFSPPLSVGESVYGYWNESPQPGVEVGDYLKGTYGLYRISSIDDPLEFTPDSYPPSGIPGGVDSILKHYKPEELGEGDSNVTFGLYDLVEGVRIRAVVIPSRDISGTNPTVIKLVGMTIGHVPQGKKTLTATGELEMPGYIPTEMQGRTYASAQGNQAGSTIAQLEQRLRNMQWNGAPPIEMQNIQAEIDRLRRQQQTTLAKQQYDLQREVNRPVLGGIGGAQNQSAMNRANEHAMLSSYLNSLFGISNSGSGGSWPGGGV